MTDTEADAILEKLKRIPIFCDIKDNKEHMLTLYNICRRKTFHKDEVIIAEGTVGDEMFVVYSGGVKINKKTRAGDTYTVVILKAQYNVFFGELALVDDDKRSATVIATEDSEFLVINKKDFMMLGNTNPSVVLPITRAISRILADRLRKTTSDMMTIFDALVHEIHD